jgi:hypothetical protein
MGWRRRQCWSFPPWLVMVLAVRRVSLLFPASQFHLLPFVRTYRGLKIKHKVNVAVK